MLVYAFRLPQGADLKAELERFTRDHALRAGCILTCVGNLSQAHLRMPGAANTFLVAINDQGVVAGWYGVTIGRPIRGFYYQYGAFTTFDPPGSELKFATKINRAGDIAGDCYTPQAGTGTFGFVLSHGHFHKYKAQPGNERDAVTSLSYVISPDDVAGNFNNIVQQYAFIYANGVYTQMTPFNATVSFVNAGNAARTLVGGYLDSNKLSRISRSLLRGAGAMHELRTP